MQLRYLLRSNSFKLPIYRYLRRSVKPSSKSHQNIETDKGDQNTSASIEVDEERVDLKSLQIPVAARLAIENDSNLTASIATTRHLKFSFDPKKILDELEEPSTPIYSLNDLDLKEDPSVPKSKVNCSGCGARLHCQSKYVEGFVPADVFRVLSKRELFYTLCFRCQFLDTKKKMLNVQTNNRFDYDKFILGRILSEPKVHVLLLIDLLDIPNSIYDGWAKLIHNVDQNKEEPKLSAQNDIDIVIVGNKYDLLPHTGPLFDKSILECLMHNCEAKGIQGRQIKYVELISAKTGFNVERLITRLFKIWNDEGNVYLLGMANAGKSVLFNQLLSSDYCRSLASEAIVRATTSFWPGTTLNMLKFPINFLGDSRKGARQRRLYKDAEELDKIETERRKMYEKTMNLKYAEPIGIVGSSFKPFSILNPDEIDANVEATYTFDEKNNQIREGQNYEDEAAIRQKRIEKARRMYKPLLYEDNSAWFYDTPGILGSQEILKYFSRPELEITFPIGIIMPRIYWMVPGQTLFVGGLIRIDLLESTENERVLFSLMASPALPIVNPFPTVDAERLYNEYYEKGAVLRVPYKNHIREKSLPSLESKEFEIDCIGNWKSTADIVFNCFGWAAVTSRPKTKALVRAWTLGASGLQLRQPSLLPFVVNMRKKWNRQDGSQAFKSTLYKKPKR